MFAHFSLPSVPDVARKTVGTGMVAGVIALIVSALVGYPLAGLGICIGLALGTINMRMIGNSVAKAAASESENKRRPLVLNTFARLGLISVVTIGLLFLNYWLGFGVLCGVALFQMIMLVNVGRSMMHAGPMTSVDDVVEANVVDSNITQAVDGPDPTGGSK